jgi:pimeloyl-ACP methyl ester carboxylesterase
MTKMPAVRHRTIDVDGLEIFYREAGPAEAPVMLLLHGFPSASHQFRRLIDRLGGDYRLIAPDYPGFGHSAAPAPVSADGEFVYSFDRLADVIERFCERIGLNRFVMYLFDYGAPIGLRIATRHPEWIAGIAVQNGNAYDEGLSPIARQIVALKPDTPGAEVTIADLLTLETTRSQYLTGASDPEVIAPDGWLLDQHFLDLPGRKAIQTELHLDYHSNLPLYPEWQAWARDHQPPALIIWGRNDPFFIEAGARAWQRDLPASELHLFDTGHFALEEKLPEIAPIIASFLDRTWATRTGRTAQAA